MAELKEYHWHPLQRPSRADLKKAAEIKQTSEENVAQSGVDHDSLTRTEPSKPGLQTSSLELSDQSDTSSLQLSSVKVPRSHLPSQDSITASITTSQSSITNGSTDSELLPLKETVSKHSTHQPEPLNASKNMSANSFDSSKTLEDQPFFEDSQDSTHKELSDMDTFWETIPSNNPSPIQPTSPSAPVKILSTEVHNQESKETDDELSWLQNDGPAESVSTDSFFNDLTNPVQSASSPDTPEIPQLISKATSYSQPLQNAPSDSLFGDTSNEDESFFVSLSSGQSNAVSPAPQPSLLVKEDPFKDIFDTDDDFEVVESVSKLNDDLLQAIGTQASGVVASTDKNLVPEDPFSKILGDDLDEETLNPSSKSKIDLSKSLAFLDDDELLPDNYVEPARPSAPPSRTRSAAPMSASVQEFSTPIIAAASITRAQSGQATPYTPQTYQHLPTHPKHSARAAPNNAFDLPSDMVAKSRSSSSFHSPPQAYPFKVQSPPFVPKPSINPNKSFFEELPIVPPKHMPHKPNNATLPHQTLNAGLNQPFSPSHVGSFNHGSQTSVATPPLAPMAPNRLPFAAPQRGHSRNSSAGYSSLGPISPSSSVYKPQYHNPYEPFNPLGAGGLSSTPSQTQYTPTASQPSASHNPYDPSSQVNRPPQLQISSQYRSASSNSSYNSPTQYSPTSNFMSPKGLQPAAQLVSKGGFGELPADIGQRQAQFARSPEVQQAVLKAKHYRTPSGQDLGQYGPRVLSPISQSGLHHSVGNGRGYSTASESEQRNASYSQQQQQQQPINNEALLRRQFPIFRWGMGGKAVSVIPPSISFGGGAATAEVKIIHPSQVLQADTLIAKFPFPLVTSKGIQRTKKKELEKWIEEHITIMEKKFQLMRPEESSHLTGRVLLWKVMLNLLQADSTIAKPSKNLKDAVRKSLDPFVQVQATEELASFAPAVDIYRKNMHRRTSSISAGTNRSLKSGDVNEIVDLLKIGEKDTALRFALDQHLWAHALLIASSIGPAAWMDAVFEFVREEIRVFPSQSARDLALMYRVFSGAGAESGKHPFILLYFSITNIFAVSEILPGQFSIALQEPTASPQLTASLSNWRSTVSMLFSNHSPMNTDAVNLLSSLLLKSGDVNAAHLCYLLFNCSNFGPKNGNQPSFELLGSDETMGAGFGRDTDSILLSLVMEFYKISTEPTLPTIPYYPHLVLYKLSLTSYLADLGNIAEAQQLFDSVSGIMKAGAKNISYRPALFDYLDFISQRLSLTYQDETTAGWLSSKLGRPNFDKVLGKLDKSFSKFVTGEEDTHDSIEQDNIFKRLADTPSVSRTQSTVDLSSMAGQSSFHRANSFGNPYAPVDFNGQQAQNFPPRSQSSTGMHHPAETGLMSPPKPNRLPGDLRPLSPYGLARGLVAPNSANNLASLVGDELTKSGYPNDLTRPKSAATNHFHRSSSNDYSTEGPNSQPTDPAIRHSNVVPKIPEGQQQGRSQNAPSGSPLRNQFSSAPAPVNPYAPSSAAYPPSSKLSNPYAPSSASTNTGSGHGQYTPLHNSTHSTSSSIGQESFQNSSASMLQGRRTPVMTSSGKLSSLSSPMSTAGISRPSSRLSHVSTAIAEEPVSQPGPSPEPRANSPEKKEPPHIAPPVTSGPAAASAPFNPYAPSSSLSNTSSTLTIAPRSNPYAPSASSGKTSSPVKEAETPNHGGFDPYSSMYGYDAATPQNTAPVLVEAEPELKTEDQDTEPVSGSQGGWDSYETPDYGHRGDEIEDDETDEVAPSAGEVFTPMGAPTFISSPFASTPLSAQSEQVQNSSIDEEEEEVEDLGFSNNSIKKKDDDEKKESEKPKVEDAEKKSGGGWFSWMRKGGSDEKKAVQIKFGDEMSLVYDPELKRYVNKNAPKESLKPTPALAPPPPPSGPPSGRATPAAAGPPTTPSFSSPPIMPGRSMSVQPPASTPPPGMVAESKSARQTPVPSSTGGGLDDLLAAAPTGTRKGARRNARTRYVDIMNQ